MASSVYSPEWCHLQTSAHRRRRNQGEGARRLVHGDQRKGRLQHQGSPASLSIRIYFHFTSASRSIVHLHISQDKHLTEETRTLTAGVVPHDRHVPAGDGRSLVGQAGGHGGHQPEACLRASGFRRRRAAGAERRRMFLLSFSVFFY